VIVYREHRLAGWIRQVTEVDVQPAP